jgi:hypothetical protein
MGRVTDADLLPEAVAELYASDPDEFIKRRGVLAAQARAAGQATVAKRIAGLRKPTRSAWIVNQLVRSDPDVGSQLAELGGQLRAAQNSLNGAAIRDLSLRRRQLIDALARQAFRISGQYSPPAAIRDEVTATLSAALADPQVADRVRAGALERAAHSEGFGTAGAQILTLVPSSSGGSRALAAAGRAAFPARAGGTATPARNGTVPGGASDSAAATRNGKNAATGLARRPAETTELAAARARAERERRLNAISEAEQEVAEADWAMDAAAKVEREQERAVQLLEERLADARHLLAEVRLEARAARTAQRHARQVFDRLLR